METTVIILAGGMSRRLGHDKLGERVGCCSLFGEVVLRVAPLGVEVIVVAAHPDVALPMPPVENLRVIGDLLPGKGPLGGVYTGLRASLSRWNVVVAADMPFLNRGLLRHMISLAHEDVDIVAPRVASGVEPLHSVYSRSCLGAIEQMLDSGELSVYRLFPLVRVRYVEAVEIDGYDPGRLSFFNVNTEEDLEEARELSNEGVAGDD